MSSVVAIGVGLAILQAAADPRAPPTPPAATCDSYVGHLVLADSLWLGLGIAGFAAGLPEALFPAGLGYLAAGPIVHLSEGEPGQAARSLGLRLGLSIAAGGLGAGIGYSYACPDDEEKSDGHVCPWLPLAAGAVLGAATGSIVAIVIDYTRLSHRTAPRPPRWTPTVTADGRAVSLGIAGRF